MTPPPSRRSRHLTVGDFRDWLLSDEADGAALAALAPGLTPEMVGGGVEDHAQPGSDPRRRANAAWSPASAIRSACPAGLPRACSPTIRPTIRAASLASIVDGLLLGCGDAVIGINPATDSPQRVHRRCCRMLDESAPAASTSRRNPAC